MPEIFLPPPAPEGSGAGTYQVPVIAVMLFPRPRDEDKRLRWQAAAYVSAYVGWAELGAPASLLAGFHRWIAPLWTLRQSPKAEFESGLRRIGRAVFAGEVLRLLLICARHHPRHFKVEHVRALISHLNQDRPLGGSESLIAKVWPEFRHASHLWAARSLTKITADPLDRSTDSEVLKHLAWAEAYRRKAEEIGVLRRGETWIPPSDVELPSVDFELDSLAFEELQWLDQQFPS
jgi:hypothetical protein